MAVEIKTIEKYTKQSKTCDKKLQSMIVSQHSCNYFVTEIRS